MHRRLLHIIKQESTINLTTHTSYKLGYQKKKTQLEFQLSNLETIYDT